MADLNSAIMANIVADPTVRSDNRINGGRIRGKVAGFTFDGTQDDADVVRFYRIRSGDIIKTLQLSNAALTGMTTVDFGLHTINGGAAVDDDLFDSAQTLAVALNRQDKRTGTDSALGVTDLDQKVFELLGLSEDPFLEYDVTMLINTSGAASGRVVLEMTYQAGD